MSRVLCRRGVARGAASRCFSAQLLLDALKVGNDGEHVYVELDSAGFITDAGGDDAARLCVRARLAPHVLGAGALLTLSDSVLPGAGALLPPSDTVSPGAGALLSLSDTAPTLRVRAVVDLAPHAELRLWFADDVLAALDMPFLTLDNIRGRRDYACHECGVTFADPNPLKVHLFLGCAPFSAAAFWRRAAARLRTARPAPGLAPARLEALAAAWGRAGAAHVCVYCGKLYSRRYGLKIHLRTHTGYRPLRCRHCLRAFGDPSNLNKHERLHAARAPAPPARYQCARCGRALARRRDLLRHERTHADTHSLSLAHSPSHSLTHAHAS